MDHKKLEIAYHEAGHAVMALICGREIERISLKGMDSPRGTDKYLGFTILKSLDPSIKFTTNKKDIQKIMISLGGYASEHLFFNSSKLRQDDLAIAIKTAEEMLQVEEFKNWVARELPIPDRDVLVMIENPLVRTYIDRLIQESIKTLERFKPAIHLISTELYKKEELAGDEVSYLFYKDLNPSQEQTR